MNPAGGLLASCPENVLIGRAGIIVGGVPFDYSKGVRRADIEASSHPVAKNLPY
jgi:hypothetical protein